MTSSRTPGSEVPEGPGVLASWTTIAKYFDCNERTAKRWEEQRGLPVHRAPGRRRGYVFAYINELDEWLRTTGRENAACEVRDEKFSFPLHAIPTTHATEPADEDSKETSKEPHPRKGFWPRWLALGTAIVITIGALWIFGSRHIARAKSAGSHSLSFVGLHTPASDAEKQYLRGRYFWNLRTTDSLSKAIDAYTQAIVEDPAYAEPYAGLAEAYELMPQFAHADLGESFTRAKRAADRAIELNPNLVAAHRAKGFALFFWDWDIAGSDAEFKRALALEPNSAETHHWYASALFHRLESQECIKQINEALRLNPASAAIAADAAFFKANFGDLAAGTRALKEIEQTQPTLASPEQFLSDIDFATGNFPAYIDDVRLNASITHDRYYTNLADALARGWARSGRKGLLEEKASTLKVAFTEGSERGFVLGETLLLLDRPKEALPYFTAAFLNYHDMGVAIMSENPQAKSLLKDPDYLALFAEVNKQFHGNHLADPANLPVAFRLPQ